MEEKELNTENTEITDDGAKEQEIAEPAVSEQTEDGKQTQPVEKTEKNAYFADLRRKQQLDRSRADNERLKQQLDQMTKALDSLTQGYTAGGYTGMDVFHQRQAREWRQTQAMHSELQMYRNREVDRMMAEDLKAVQAIDPTITSLNDLPDTFLALRFNRAAPMSADKAFVAMKAIETQTKIPKPASVGSILGRGAAESEFFTAEELDALTPKMLDDKRIMEKALRSMARLK